MCGSNRAGWMGPMFMGVRPVSGARDITKPAPRRFGCRLIKLCTVLPPRPRAVCARPGIPVAGFLLLNHQQPATDQSQLADRGELGAEICNSGSHIGQAEEGAAGHEHVDTGFGA